MEQRKLLSKSILTVIVASVLMFLMHDLYKITENRVLSFFTPVNESIFEHSKMIFYALLVTYILGYFYYGDKYKNYWFARLISLIIAPIFLVILYYTYSGVLGYNIMWVDILIGILSIIIAEVISYKIFSRISHTPISNTLIITIIILIALGISLLSYYPLEIDLFKDSTTGVYGIQ